MQTEVNRPRGNELEFFHVVKQMIGDDYEEVTVGPPYFRPNTKLPVVKYNFVFVGAGMGDFICYMPAMLRVANSMPWIKGRVFGPTFFSDFAKNIMRDHLPRWKVGETERINEQLEPRTVLRGPGVKLNNMNTNGQLLNGTGGHLVDVGHAYFVNEFPPKPGTDYYPVIDFSYGGFGMRDHLPTFAPKSYVVFTPGGITESRTVPGEYWNPIIDHVMKLGLTPVVLGKTNLANCLNVSKPDGFDYHRCVDLWDKTTMLEAAWIMKNAAVVTGLDNGLIQLASCTDASIVAGYNIVHPMQRRPKRLNGIWREVYLRDENDGEMAPEIECANCQTNMKCLPTHSFKTCIYGDKKCLELIFDNRGRRWIDLIDNILN